MFRELLLEDKKPKKPKLSKEVIKILDDLDKLLDLDNVKLKEAKNIGGLTQGSLKEILAIELSKFDSISKIYILDGKIAIDGKLNAKDKSGVIKQVSLGNLNPKDGVKLADMLNKKLAK